MRNTRYVALRSVSFRASRGVIRHDRGTDRRLAFDDTQHPGPGRRKLPPIVIASKPRWRRRHTQRNVVKRWVRACREAQTRTIGVESSANKKIEKMKKMKKADSSIDASEDRRHHVTRIEQMRKTMRDTCAEAVVKQKLLAVRLGFSACER